jgi:hypothetical protein
MWLGGVSVEEELVGRGGEVHVYTGNLKGDRVVVRTVVESRNFWKSRQGPQAMKVVVIIPLGTFSSSEGTPSHISSYAKKPSSTPCSDTEI